MTPARRLVRTLLPTLLLASGVVAALPVAYAATPPATTAHAPAAPSEPEPQPQPQPGPVVPPPESGPGTARPEPAPGPTPSPGKPKPRPSRPSAPEPAPGPTPPATPSDPNAEGFFGNLLDIPGMVINAITGFLGRLLEEAMKPLRELIADTLLAAPDVTKHADIKRLWTAAMGITAGIYVLFVTAGGVTVMGHETVQTSYALKQIAPRLLLGIAAASTSLTVMGKTIRLGNSLTHAIMGTDMADAGQGLVERALPFALFGPTGIAIYLLLLAVVELVLIIAVLVGFIVRVALMALLAVLAPLALACHAHPLTDPVARLWWRGLAGCLVIQIAQSMTFILALKLFFAPGATTLGIPKADELGTLLAGVALFWVLFKIPGWTLQVVLRGSPIQQPHAPAPVRMLRHLAMYQLMGHYLPGGRGAARRPRRGGIRPGGGGGGGGPHGGGGPLPGRGGGGGRSPRPGRGGAGGGAAARRAPRPGGAPYAAAGRPAVGANAAGGAPQPPQAPAPGPAPHRPAAPARPGGRRAAPVRPATPGQPAAPGRPAAPGPRPAPGPRAVPHPAQARRRQQLALPIAAPRVPANPGRAIQQPLPIAAQRVPAAQRTTPITPPSPATPARQPVRRARQLALPIPAARVRQRPARPVQLRLPLEPPAPPTPRK